MQALLLQSSSPPLPKQACPLPFQKMPGYPQEVVLRLRNFRATKFPLRHNVGSRVGERYVVDVCALMCGECMARCGTQEYYWWGGEGMDPSLPRSDTVEAVVLLGWSAEAGGWYGRGHAVVVALCG